MDLLWRRCEAAGRSPNGTATSGKDQRDGACGIAPRVGGHGMVGFRGALVNDWTPSEVSRETYLRLAAFAERLLKWNRALNLVSSKSASEVWKRHILDSLQLWPLRNRTARIWLDLGSGGGFPAIPLAILAAEVDPEMTFTLIESDTRKAAFLSDTIREFELRANVIAGRIETIQPLEADIISARALAPLIKSLDLADRHRTEDSEMLLMKGKRVTSELTEAQQYWMIRYEAVSSRTDPEAKILIIREFHRLP